MSVGDDRARRARRPPPAPLPRSPDFGLDAPRVVYAFGWGGIALLTGAMLLPMRAGHTTTLRAIVAAMFAVGFLCLANAVAMVASSGRGKLAMRERILDALALDGSERVLDAGCGRGLLLVGAAQRLTQGGHGIGVDRWSQRGQRAGSRVATLENARRAAVADRVAVVDGDVQALPVRDASFDLVLSSLALHHVPTPAGRAKAVAELARVVRPGGRIVIADVACTREYAAALRAAGVASVLRSGLRLWTWPPVRVVLARR